MKLTSEQKAILNSTGNIKINAVAGSGKTTTIIEYAKTRPKGSRILYLAFNRTVKEEAIKKFAEANIPRVKVKTAHSLAYQYIVPNGNYKVRSHGYKTHELVDILKLKGDKQQHTEYVLANHIMRFMTYFCNSSAKKVNDLNYLSMVTDPKAKKFVKSFYKVILKNTRLLLGKMNNGAIEIIHDFYLKKFQLSNPRLPYDYILFDEGQDASPAMLEVFLNQKAIKVIVGDTHQQIYGWRHAVNSLQMVDFDTYKLSNSFRFRKDVADLAKTVLEFKNKFSSIIPVTITGKGRSRKRKVKAVLARTNLGLLLKAIDYVVEKGKVKKIFFEGNINSYTYAEEGASLYDILNLYNNQHKLIRDKLIKEMGNIKELEEYIDRTEDVQLSMMLEVVKKYGSQIPQILRTLKDLHVENKDRSKAEIIFSTVHRCKGMEYDSVQLVNDFINEQKLDKMIELGEMPELSKLNEEINLLYVAITRTKHYLYIPEDLIPSETSGSKRIIPLKKVIEEPDLDPSIANNRITKVLYEAADFGYQEIRRKHKDAYQPWNQSLDDELTIKYCEGVSIDTLANHFGRTRGAIRSRIKKLELKEIYK